ncbi:MAG: hypothetical protein JW820_11075 [Spirochaetales bacterium]|nr:hypothetical protein [Spirochaetales bacterium]
MKGRRGRIERVEPVLEGRRLKVRVSVLVEGEGPRQAYLPEREVAALLPRCLLAGSPGGAPPELLDTLEPILARLVGGRTVRLWSWQERSYASFLPWRSVRFAQEDPAGAPQGRSGPAGG